MKVFITGVSSGVGEALARQLVKAGHLVWGIARRDELLKKMQSELGVDKFLFSKCDISNEDDINRTVEMMKMAGFLPEIVILNAAIFSRDTDPQYQYPLFKEAMAVNIFGSLTWVDKFIPDFLKRGSGSFIAISSISAHLHDAESISYPASKAAISMAFRGLRMRYRKNGIKFSTVHFGPIATKLVPSWSSENGLPRYPFVISSKKAAEKILKVINKKSGDYWFPFFTTLFFRALSIPGDIFLRFIK
mgnify:FL=1